MLVGPQENLAIGGRQGGLVALSQRVARQDFQHGYAQIRPGAPEPEFHPVVDPASLLPPHLGGHILRQPDGTAWLVVKQRGRLVRQWIPDGETWNCIGGDAVAVHPDTDGSVVAALEYAGHAHCPARQ